MATIHVNRAGTNLGTFSEDDVRAGLRAGRFVGTDLGWREGMASWQPLSQFAEFVPDISAAAAAPPPAAAPAMPAAGAAAPLPAAPPGTSMVGPTARAGLPWDDRHQRGFFNAFFETVMMVLTRPTEAFTAMKREGGLGDALIYALIGAGAGAIVSLLLSLTLQSIGISAGHQNSLAWMAGFGIGSFFMVILVPVFVVVFLFIGSAIMHLCLMIVGGARQSFETTFRVLAFSQGSTGILQMVPVCGGLIAGVWGLIVNCIGLARAHETETWRAVLAVFLPVIVCCGGGFIIAMMFGMLGALGQHGTS